MHFTGKTALVTGAARGIGRATAEALAAAGARVVVVDIDEAEARLVAESLRAGGSEAFAARCDIASDTDVAALAKTVVESAGLPDLLINNAFARQLARGTVDNIDIEVCKRAYDINVLGNVRMLKAFLPLMLARGSGHIVDTASSLSIVPNPDTQMMLPYVASKGAILGMAYGLRYALHSRGIAYSLFCPGLTDTRPAHEKPIALEPSKAAPVSFAVSTLLLGIQRGDFLISSEPDFEAVIVKLAQNKLDPLALFG